MRSYFRHGNSTTVFHDLDRFVTERMARFITKKHGYRGRGYGMWVLRGNEHLGLQRLVGTSGTVLHDRPCMPPGEGTWSKPSK